MGYQGIKGSFSETLKRKRVITNFEHNCSIVSKIKFEVYTGETNNIYHCGGAFGRLISRVLIKIR